MIISLSNFRRALFAAFAVCLLTVTGLATTPGFPAVRWEIDLNAAMVRAEREQRPLFIHFVGNDTPAAQQMEREVFVQPQIASQLNATFVMVRINASENAALIKKFEVTQIPTDLILKPNGQPIHRRVGVIPAEKFAAYLAHLQKIINPVPPGSSAVHPAPPMTGSLQHNPMTPSTAMLSGTMLPNTVPTQREMGSVADPFARPSPTMQPPAGLQMPPTVAASVPTYPGNNPLRTGGEPMARPAMGPVVNDPQSSFLGAVAPPATVAVAPAIPVVLTAEPAPPKQTVEVPLALEGCCPITLCTKEQWVPGNPAYCVMYQGHLFRFATAEALATFALKPANYVPVAMGEDIVLMVERNKRVNGIRDFGAYCEGRIFLFSSQETFDIFRANAGHYMEIALKYELARKEQPTPLVY